MRGGFVPGDVAADAKGVRYVRYDAGVEAGWWRCVGVDRYFGPDLDGLRRLVVIDPEDREQVDRLTNLFFNERSRGDRVAIGGGSTDAMQAALRSLIADPKPEEPLGLGAVVEDADGFTWVRTHTTGYPWHANLNPDDRNSTAVRKYDDIAAVKVLSEGVTP